MELDALALQVFFVEKYNWGEEGKLIKGQFLPHSIVVVFSEVWKEK